MAHQPAHQAAHPPADPPADPPATPPDAGPAPRPTRTGSGVLAGRRTSAVLLAVALALAVVVAMLGLLLWLPGDDAEAGWSHQAGEPWTSPGDSEHPVTVGPVEWRAATDAAADAVKDILTVDWKDYDQHRKEVVDRMTPSFAEEYAVTAGDSRDTFIRSRADYDFVVVGQSVVSASEEEATALLFLNQYVYKGEGEDRVGPDVYQVRVMVTVVRQDGEWLVDSLDAL